ncbi:hypothetical protein NF556_19820 [Ornithinimicrobium faecis]|uniref:Uncharacterized protein n=1 Tax=Ornithinimicrobium faecis TaxID=2934158 RepID=A0ABY4YSS3_9MICO|nr:hypothetical protein [Ornithinimicrobium sp. HY1793]USQ79807.1 hypothetical protein NF556_19820 [Ornithinimicrobium sp. HY1793]
MLDFVDTVLGEVVRPIPPLIIAGHVSGLTGARLSVATAILLGPKVGEVLEIDRPVTHRAAAAVAGYVGLDGAVTGADGPLTHVHGSGTDLRITSSLEGLADLALDIPDRRVISLTEMPSHRASGSLLAGDRWVTCTNSWVHALDRPAAWLAVPVLLAEQASASRIVAPACISQALTRDQRAALEDLVDAADLRILWLEAERETA